MSEDRYIELQTKIAELVELTKYIKLKNEELSQELERIRSHKNDLEKRNQETVIEINDITQEILQLKG